MELAAAELLTPHNQAHSFFRFVFLFSLFLLPFLWCPFQPCISFCPLLNLKTSFLSLLVIESHHIPRIFLFSFTNAHHLSFYVIPSLFLSYQCFRFYGLQNNVLLISIFLWFFMWKATASRIHAQRGKQGCINIVLPQENSLIF